MSQKQQQVLYLQKPRLIPAATVYTLIEFCAPIIQFALWSGLGDNVGFEALC